MKIIGAFIIIGVCWMIGADYYKSNMKKLAFIKGFFDGVEFLRSEIVYSCDFLGESLLKSAVFSGEAAEFMRNIGSELNEKGVSTKEAFEKNESLLRKNVNNEEYLLIKDMFLQLGEKDCENQEKMIDGFLEKLLKIIDRQSNFCQKECVMLKKTGAVVGVGIAVLLI